MTLDDEDCDLTQALHFRPPPSQLPLVTRTDPVLCAWAADNSANTDFGGSPSRGAGDLSGCVLPRWCDDAEVWWQYGRKGIGIVITHLSYACLYKTRRQSHHYALCYCCDCSGIYNCLRNSPDHPPTRAAAAAHIPLQRI